MHNTERAVLMPKNITFCKYYVRKKMYPLWVGKAILCNLQDGLFSVSLDGPICCAVSV